MYNMLPLSLFYFLSWNDFKHFERTPFFNHGNNPHHYVIETYSVAVTLSVTDMCYDIDNIQVL